MFGAGQEIGDAVPPELGWPQGGVGRPLNSALGRGKCIAAQKSLNSQ